MRKILLSAVSAVALALSGAAFAGQTSTENTQDQAGTEQPAVQGAATQDNAAESSAAQGSAASADDATAGATSTSTEMEDGQRYGSYQNDPAAFSGEIAGGYLADDLIGKSLIDANGDSVGEVNDLLIGQNNQIDKVLVDVGGFLGIGERRVALDIEELQVSEDGQFLTNMTSEQLEEMPEYNRMDAEWTEMPSAE